MGPAKYLQMLIFNKKKNKAKVKQKVKANKNKIKIKSKKIKTSNNHRLESAGLNALEELLRCWECTEKIVKQCSMCILKLDVFGYFA